MAISKKLVALMCALGLSVASLAGCESNNAGAGGSGDGGNSGTSSGEGSGGSNSNTSEYDIEEIHYNNTTGEPFTCIANYHLYVIDTGFESTLTSNDAKYKTDDYVTAANCDNTNNDITFVSYDIVENVDDALESYGGDRKEDSYGVSYYDTIDKVATEIAVVHYRNNNDDKYSAYDSGPIFIKTIDGYIVELSYASRLYEWKGRS